MVDLDPAWTLSRTGAARRPRADRRSACPMKDGNMQIACTCPCVGCRRVTIVSSRAYSDVSPHIVPVDLGPVWPLVCLDDEVGRRYTSDGSIPV